MTMTKDVTQILQPSLQVRLEKEIHEIQQRQHLPEGPADPSNNGNVPDPGGHSKVLAAFLPPKLCSATHQTVEVTLKATRSTTPGRCSQALMNLREMLDNLIGDPSSSGTPIAMPR